MKRSKCAQRCTIIPALLPRTRRARQRSNALHYAIVVAISATVPPKIHATTLTGINLFAADASGAYDSGGYSNTIGGDDVNFNLYGLVGLPPASLATTNPFINSGNLTKAPTRISIDLCDPGLYSYTFLADSSRGTIGPFAGVNFFFNSDDITPGISAFEALNSTGPSFFPPFDADSAASTATLNPLVNGEAAGSGSLSFADGTNVVTLTECRSSVTSVFGVDRVSGFDIGPNGYDDFVLEFTLSVTAISAISVPAGTTQTIPARNGSEISVVVKAGIAIEGSLVMNPANNRSNRQLLVVTAPGLSIAGTTGNWTGLLDLSNNDMDLPGASLATVTDQIRQGYNNGSWNATGGIISSSAAGDSSHLTALSVIQNNQNGLPLFTTFDTYAVGASDILVKYTYYGDANLDGKVDGSDYSLIDSGHLQHLTGWLNGDFNYDGVIDGSDYTLIDNAFNTQGAQMSAVVSKPTAEVAASSQVPEPGMVAAGVVVAPLLRRLRL